MVGTRNGPMEGFLQAIKLGFGWIVEGGERRITGDEISTETALIAGFCVRKSREINEEDDC